MTTSTTASSPTTVSTVVIQTLAPDVNATHDMTVQGDLTVDGTINGTLVGAAAAGSLTGTTLASNVVTSSLTSTGTLTGVTTSGNLTFTTGSNRITGDFSNATVANRVLVQSSTVNGVTSLGFIPNGTGIASGGTFYANSDNLNSPYLTVTSSTTAANIEANKTGTGVAQDLLLSNSGLRGVAVTSGVANVVIGGTAALSTSATDRFLYLPTCAGTPTGVPTAIANKAPLVVDSTNNKLYLYTGGAWVAMN